jgi:probable addiction module antidote protein
MTAKTNKWDAASALDTPERIALYLEEAFEDGDAQLISAAIGDVARAHGMTQLSKETGITREALYRALSDEGNPEFSTVLKVLGALGIRLAPVRGDAEAA